MQRGGINLGSRGYTFEKEGVYFTLLRRAFPAHAEGKGTPEKMATYVASDVNCAHARCYKSTCLAQRLEDVGRQVPLTGNSHSKLAARSC